MPVAGPGTPAFPASSRQSTALRSPGAASPSPPARVSNASAGTRVGGVQSRIRALERLAIPPQQERAPTTRLAQVIQDQGRAHGRAGPGPRSVTALAAEDFNREAMRLRHWPEQDRKAIVLALLPALERLSAEHRADGFDTLLGVLPMVPEQDRATLMPQLQQIAQEVPLTSSPAQLLSLLDTASLHPAMAAFTARVRAQQISTARQLLEEAQPVDRPARLHEVITLLALQPEPARAAGLASLIEASERGPTLGGDLPLLLDALHHLPESERTPLFDRMLRLCSEHRTTRQENRMQFASWLPVLPREDRTARFNAGLALATRQAGDCRACALTDLAGSLIWLPERDRQRGWDAVVRAMSPLPDADRVDCMTALANQIAGLPPVTWAPALLTLVTMAHGLPAQQRQTLLERWSPLPAQALERFDAWISQNVARTASADTVGALAAARHALTRLAQQTTADVTRIRWEQTRSLPPAERVQRMERLYPSLIQLTAEERAGWLFQALATIRMLPGSDGDDHCHRQITCLATLPQADRYGHVDAVIRYMEQSTASFPLTLLCLCDTDAAQAPLRRSRLAALARRLPDAEPLRTSLLDGFTR